MFREIQDLKHGAVRSAMLSEGSGAKPGHEGVVFFQFLSVSGSATAEVVTSMMQQLESGAGIMHVATLGKGVRLPRGWELILTGGAPTHPVGHIYLDSCS
jgi:hypothetical protein